MPLSILRESSGFLRVPPFEASEAMLKLSQMEAPNGNESEHLMEESAQFF